MTKFERALSDAMADKERLAKAMRNEQYRDDVLRIKEFVNTNTGFKFLTISVTAANHTILKLRAKEKS